jgi:hypothetical protein
MSRKIDGVPVNRQPGDVESQYSGFHERLQEQQFVREQEQKENARAKERAWLSDEWEGLAEWRQRREFDPCWEPRIPQDEMTFADYKKSRDRKRRVLVEIDEATLG